VRAADEERIVEDVAQAGQGVADGGLRQTHVFGDRSGAAAAKEAPKDEQQAAVKASDIIGVDITHERNSVSELWGRA
jgi:hypothetical protein